MSFYNNLWGRTKQKGSSSLFASSGKLDRTSVINITGDNPFDITELVKVVIKPAGRGNLDSGAIGNLPRNLGLSIEAIVTGMNLSTEVRQNVTYTLGNNIYLYVFGESIYKLSFSGFGYLSCDSGDTTLEAFNKLIDFYKDNNVAKEGKYCQILLGDKVFKGYLIHHEIGLTSDTPSLVPFKLSFIGIFEE